MAAKLGYNLAADAQKKRRLWLQWCNRACLHTDTTLGCHAVMQTAEIIPAGPMDAWSKSSPVNAYPYCVIVQECVFTVFSS